MAALREIVPDRLWVADASHRMMGIEMGTRMTVVRLADGGLFLHSPVDLDPDLRAGLEALGPVRDVVAPSRMHYLCVPPYFSAFPEAKLYGAPGVQDRLKDVSFHGTLGDRPEEAWAAELDQTLFGGAPAVQEVVFFHPATRTLILTDLCFYLPAESPFGTRLFARFSGVYEQLSPTRLFRSLIRDRAAARASIDRILTWDFDRVLLCHGRIIESGGRERFRQAWAWLP